MTDPFHELYARDIIIEPIDVDITSLNHNFPTTIVKLLPSMMLKN